MCSLVKLDAAKLLIKHSNSCFPYLSDDIVLGAKAAWLVVFLRRRFGGMWCACLPLACDLRDCSWRMEVGRMWHFSGGSRCCDDL